MNIYLNQCIANIIVNSFIFLCSKIQSYYDVIIAHNVIFWDYFCFQYNIFFYSVDQYRERPRDMTKPHIFERWPAARIMLPAARVSRFADTAILPSLFIVLPTYFCIFFLNGMLSLKSKYKLMSYGISSAQSIQTWPFFIVLKLNLSKPFMYIVIYIYYQQ